MSIIAATVTVHLCENFPETDIENVEICCKVIVAAVLSSPTRQMQPDEIFVIFDNPGILNTRIEISTILLLDVNANIFQRAENARIALKQAIPRGRIKAVTLSIGNSTTSIEPMCEDNVHNILNEDVQKALDRCRT